MHRTPVLLICFTLVVTTVGCQRYQTAPLDLTGHESLWAGRDPSAAAVSDYAKRLSESGGVPSRHFDPEDGITIGEAEVVALFFNPQLRAARMKARVPVVGAAEAGRWEDPELGVDAERVIESVEHPWVLGGMLGFTIPLSGRLGAEKNRAWAEADAARFGVLVEESRVLADLQSRWLALAMADHRLELVRSYVSDLDRIVANAERLRERGELDPIEAKLFRLEQVRRRAELRGLELQRRESEAAVKAVLGLVTHADVRLLSSLSADLVKVEPSERRHFLVENHPRLRQARAEYAVAERSLELEIRKQYPDLGLGGGLGTDDGEARVLGGLRIPIPIFNANRRAIAEARANRDASRAAAEATYEELAGALARAEIGLEVARGRREVIEKELAPLADEQLRDARNLGRLGDVGTVVILEALTRAHETKVELLEAIEKEAAAVNQLNELLRSGGGVDPDAGSDGKP